MTAANALAETWVRSLAAATWQGGLFILGVWVLCFAFRRLPAWVKACLWWIASAQLLVRLFLTVPISVPVEHSLAPIDLGTITSSTPLARYVANEPVISLPSPVVKSERMEEPISPQLLLASVWLLGLSVGAVIAGVRLLRARRLLRHAEPLHHAYADQVLESLWQGHGRKPRLLHAPSVKCPLLAGYVRPAIVFPTGVEALYGPAEIRMAIAHEVVHLRRRDQWTSLLLAITSTVFFYHPLAWLATREAAVAREEACDLEALCLSGETSTDYAHFLLKSAQARTPVASLGAAYGYRNLRRRITMLKTSNPLSTSNSRRTWAALIAAGFAAALPWTVVAQSAKNTTPAKKDVAAVSKKTAIAKKPQPKAVTKTAIADAAVAQTDAKRAIGEKIDHAVEMKSAGIAKGSRDSAVSIAGRATQAKGVDVPGRTYRIFNVASPIWDTKGEATLARPGQTVRAVSENAPTSEVATTTVRAIDEDSPIQISLQQLSPDVPLESRMSVKLVRAEVGQALTKLLSEAGCDFVIKAKIRPEVITCRFQNVPAEKALDMILRGIDQDLTFRIEGNVIFIVDKGS